VSESCAVIDIVGADYRSEEFLKEIVFFIAAPCRGKSSNGIGTVLLFYCTQPLCNKVNCLFPAHLLKFAVFPHKRLSLQRHQRRSEHWYVLDGRAEVTLEDTTIVLVAGQSVDIPAGALHRIANPGSENVRFIEVQTGEYFGEDDIERCDDDFGRT